jgi:SAM-dependent methyltransferase
MFTESAEYYDLVYRSKDYQGEVQKLRDLFAKYVPNARSILDVACGTAEHLRFLSGFERVGVDINPAFIRLAREKLPEVKFHVGDMTELQLGMKFDVILCLFSSIGYLLDDESIQAALSHFRNHLEPTGAIFIEPWIEPDAWSDRPPDMVAAEEADRMVCRVMNSRREDDRSFLDAFYLLVNRAEITYVTERHQLRLLSRQQWSDFFRSAGLLVEYLPEGLMSRGLYVARF